MAAARLPAEAVSLGFEWGAAAPRGAAVDRVVPLAMAIGCGAGAVGSVGAWAVGSASCASFSASVWAAFADLVPVAGSGAGLSAVGRGSGAAVSAGVPVGAVSPGVGGGATASRRAWTALAIADAAGPAPPAPVR
ncbi:hypothetical protein [Streptomyces longwoodensis]|uniref:hypothetical protein n=1 Tax=Streptomyces longwoodensis TaxID=68231 RepID=UPI00340127F8